MISHYLLCANNLTRLGTTSRTIYPHHHTIYHTLTISLSESLLCAFYCPMLKGETYQHAFTLPTNDIFAWMNKRVYILQQRVAVKRFDITISIYCVWVGFTILYYYWSCLSCSKPISTFCTNAFFARRLCSHHHSGHTHTHMYGIMISCAYECGQNVSSHIFHRYYHKSAYVRSKYGCTVVEWYSYLLLISVIAWSSFENTIS